MSEGGLIVVGIFGFFVFCVLLVVFIVNLPIVKRLNEKADKERIEIIKKNNEKEKSFKEFLEKYQIDKTYTIPNFENHNMFIKEENCFCICKEQKKIIVYKLSKQKTYEFTKKENIPEEVRDFNEWFYKFDYAIKVFNFDDIIECQILEDNETIQKGGVGRAVVGAALAGGVGAVVGATTRKSYGVVNSLKIRLILKDILNPYYEIPFIQKQTERNGEMYNFLFSNCQEIYAAIVAIINSEKN